MKLLKQRLWLCLPLFISYVADVTATMLGQSSNYWDGVYHDVNESNPASHWLLSNNPLAYISFRIISLIIVVFLISILPINFAKVLATFTFIAHTIGTYDWLKDVFYVGYAERVTLVFLLTLIFTYAYAQAETQIKSRVDT